MSTQCLSIVLTVFHSPKNFHTKMIIASFKCNCTGFRFSFVPLTQTRIFQPMQQQNTILVEFTAFKHAATIHQLHKAYAITFTSSLKALFPFPQFNPKHFNCNFGMFFCLNFSCCFHLSHCIWNERFTENQFEQPELWISVPGSTACTKAM